MSSTFFSIWGCSLYGSSADDNAAGVLQSSVVSLEEDIVNRSIIKACFFLEI